MSSHKFPPKKLPRVSLPGLFLLVRLILFLSLPLKGLTGYGDLAHFHGWAALEGWPFLNYWVEFPPAFPFLNAALYRLAGGQPHAHAYLLAITFSLFQAGNLALFTKIAQKLWGEAAGMRRAWLYFALLAGLFYGWGYFDPLAVFSLLLGALWLLEGKDARAGLALGVGILVKWFPVLALPAVWRNRPPRQALLVTATALGLAGIVYGGLYLASPGYTLAGLRSQGSKGSWETVWALLDGNLMTGNFGAKEERYDPATAGQLRGNPARIPSAVTLIPFAVLGLWLFSRADLTRSKAFLAFMGITWGLFLLWSPGWSPQWALYLLPLTLLTLRARAANLMAVTLVLINLIEWPLLLSRGLFWGLWITIPLRTLLIVLLLVEFAILVKKK